MLAKIRSSQPKGHTSVEVCRVSEIHSASSNGSIVLAWYAASRLPPCSGISALAKSRTIVTASATTMEETRKTVYNRIRSIIIPNMFYRTDIGARWNEDSDRLTMWGYL